MSRVFRLDKPYRFYPGKQYVWSNANKRLGSWALPRPVWWMP